MKIAPIQTRWRVTLTIEHDDRLGEDEIADALREELAPQSLIFGKRTPRSNFGCRAQIHHINKVVALEEWP